MSETNSPSNNRQYEGPAELLAYGHDEFMLRGNGPGGSYADHLTREYGPEGTGWGFDTEDPRHAEHNKQEHDAHGAEFRLAYNALRNQPEHLGYRHATGGNRKLEQQLKTRHPDHGNVVLYPDGKAYQAQKNS